MSILITGGAGYIGSHFAWRCHDDARNYVILDDLSAGSPGHLPDPARLVVGDVGDAGLVEALVARHGIETVVHFAGSIVVPDSVADPLGYYLNNTSKSRNLIAAVVRAGVGRMIFSSTAAVYGHPGNEPVAEEAPTDPLSPYGRSKLMTEWMLEDAGRAHGLRYVVLRYFNVAGADPQARTGLDKPGATHLIKLATAAALDPSRQVSIFGTDYETRDGTGVRDYIHVTDLVDAHMLALDWLGRGGASEIFNCGYGTGTSVREVIAAVEAVCGRRLNVVDAPRRPGDPAFVVADASKIRRMLGFTPRHQDLDTIIRTALAWEATLAARRTA